MKARLKELLGYNIHGPLLDYCLANLKILGHGTSRIAFALSDSQALKIALGKANPVANRGAV